MLDLKLLLLQIAVELLVGEGVAEAGGITLVHVDLLDVDLDLLTEVVQLHLLLVDLSQQVDILLHDLLVLLVVLRGTTLQVRL